MDSVQVDSEGGLADADLSRDSLPLQLWRTVLFTGQLEIFFPAYFY